LKLFFEANFSLEQHLKIETNFFTFLENNSFGSDNGIESK
jgi:hypothetical protein